MFPLGLQFERNSPRVWSFCNFACCSKRNNFHAKLSERDIDEPTTITSAASTMKAAVEIAPPERPTSSVTNVEEISAPGT
jgi:hypothetical protein